MDCARRFARLVYLSALVLIPSCAGNEPEEEPSRKPTAAAPVMVGRIASVPADGRFVLIQRYGSAKLKSGTVLTAHGDPDRSANLLVTGESLGQFAAADLRSGQVQVGDGVYSHPAPTPEDPPEAEASDAQDVTQQSENESDTKTENVQKNN